MPKIEMNLSIHREVKRARRRERVGQGPVLQEWGSHLVCFFCKRPVKWMVYYLPGFDRTIRIYTCGYHVRRYRRMISRERGFPQVSIEGLYVS